MRNRDHHIVPTNAPTQTALADDLVRAARLDLDLYRRRQWRAESAIRATGADSVLAELRGQLDRAARRNPVGVAVVLAAAIADLDTQNGVTK